MTRPTVSMEPQALYHAWGKGCGACPHRGHCLPELLDGEAVGSLEAVRLNSGPLRAGSRLVRRGDRQDSLYAIKSGCLKSFRLAADGSEQVVAFHLPGELIGLEALDGGYHSCDVQALELATVCAFPVSRLAQVADELPALQRQLLCMTSRALAAALHEERDGRAESRIAGFLLGLSRRMGRRGWSERRFRLAMPRRDIASYLGMAPETLSRALRQMVADGLVRVDRREVELLDVAALKGVMMDPVAGRIH